MKVYSGVSSVIEKISFPQTVTVWKWRHYKLQNSRFLGSMYHPIFEKRASGLWLPLSTWHIPVTFKTVSQAHVLWLQHYVKHCVCQQKWSINYWSMKFAMCFNMQCHSDKWHRRWSFCFIRHSFLSNFYGLYFLKIFKKKNMHMNNNYT
jgi:hypothetical protein